MSSFPTKLYGLLAPLAHSFLDLIFPPHCLHCNEIAEEATRFCNTCTTLLDMINPLERCRYCFTHQVDSRRICFKCRRDPPLMNGLAAAFDYMGPAATLVKRLKYGGMPYLAKGLAAYLFLQFDRLNWPKPDCIVPVPMDRLKQFDRGYNQSLLIAKAFGDLLGAPVRQLLAKNSYAFSQAGQTYQQRLSLKSEAFMLEKETSLKDQCVLVIDDVMTTGKTLSCCAEALRDGLAKSVYALVFCRAPSCGEN